MTGCPETVTDSLTITGSYDSPEIDCCPVEAENTNIKVKDDGSGYSYAFPAEAPGGPKAPEGEPGVDDPLNPDCTWIHKISDSSLLETKTYIVPEGADALAVAATYTITSREDPDCSVTCKHQLTVTADEPGNCCPISTEDGTLPTAYDYGKGYTVSWPAKNSLGFAPPSDADSDCTYTTKLTSSDAPGKYYVPNGSFITLTATYTITNDGDPKCSKTVTDSLTIKGKYKEIDCCPVEAEDTTVTGKDSGDGFSYSFPAEAPGGPKAPEGEPGVYDPVLNPDCTWIHKISDSSLLEEKTYTVAKGATEMAVAATYTITAAEDPDCSVTCKHQLKVFADKPNCCPMKTNPGQHPPACDYGKGYWFTWPATSINPATAGTPNAGEPPVAENCTYTTVLDPDTVEEPTQLYFTSCRWRGQ